MVAADEAYGVDPPGTSAHIVAALLGCGADGDDGLYFGCRVHLACHLR